MDEKLTLSRSDATIPTQHGCVAVGLRHYTRQGGEYVYDGEVTWLGFDEHDPERSRQAVSQSRQLSFEIWADELQQSGSIYAYFGRPDEPWDEELSIRLKFRYDQGEWGQWWVESEDESEDLERFRTNYWCAARARVLFFHDDGSGRTPLRGPDDELISVNIAIGDEESEYYQLYNGVLDQLSQDDVKGDLSSRFHRFVDFQNLGEEAETTGLSLYKRLQGVLPRYEDALRKILRDPNTTLVPAVATYDLEDSEIEPFYRGRSSAPSMSRVTRARRVNGRSIPVCFRTVEGKQSADIADNRFVAYSIRHVRDCIERVCRHLKDEKETVRLKKHGPALRRVRNASERFRRYLQNLPESVRRADGHVRPQLTTATAYYDGRYATLQQQTDLLDALLDYVNASSEAIPFEVQAFNKAYEHWTFVEVVEALCTMGFNFVDEKGRRTTPFYRNPVPGEVNCRLIHPDIPERILEVWYDKEYSVLRRRHDYFDTDRPYGLERRTGRTTYTGQKRRPDIALEFHERSSAGGVIKGQPPSIITLDPTLRSPRPLMQQRGQEAEDKYHYRKGIRCFIEEDSEGYSRKVVDAAWGISPCLGRSYSNYRHRPSDSESFEFGFAVLRPEEESINALPETLKQIMVSCEWFPHAEE